MGLLNLFGAVYRLQPKKHAGLLSFCFDVQIEIKVKLDFVSNNVRIFIDDGRL